MVPIAMSMSLNSYLTLNCYLNLASRPFFDSRISNNIKRLLELIQEFPKTNPSTTDKSSELDVEKLFSRIRSRYRVLCSSLGMAPRLRTATSDNGRKMTTEDEELEDGSDSSGPSRPKVWSIMSQLDSSVTNQDLSY
jgi:hypothetical protein